MDMSIPQVVTILQALVAAGLALLLLYELVAGRTGIGPRVARTEDPTRYWGTLALHAVILAAIVYMAVE
jgi:hypothetical protein